MNSSENNIIKLSESVANLQKDIAQVATLVERLDVTIEKLTEVSASVSQLLAVQGSRLDFQEKIHERLEKVVEERRQDNEKNIKDIYLRIETVEKELQKDMDESYEKIAKKIDEYSNSGAEQHKVINDRMTRMEKWMWMLIGGGIVIGTLFSHINYSNIFSG